MSKREFTQKEVLVHEVRWALPAWSRRKGRVTSPKSFAVALGVELFHPFLARSTQCPLMLWPPQGVWKMPVNGRLSELLQVTSESSSRYLPAHSCEFAEMLTNVRAFTGYGPCESRLLFDIFRQKQRESQECWCLSLLLKYLLVAQTK